MLEKDSLKSEGVSGLEFRSVNIIHKFSFWKVHGIMNTSGLLQNYTLQETRSSHDSMKLPKIEFIS